MVSNCCGESIMENTDLCSGCKEHCEAVSEVKYFDEAMETSGKEVYINGVKHETK